MSAVATYNRSVNSALVACDAQIATAVAQIQELRGPTGTGSPTTTDGTIAQAHRAMHAKAREVASFVYTVMSPAAHAEFNAALSRAQAELLTCRNEYNRLSNTYSALCGWDFNPATDIIRNTEGEIVHYNVPSDTVLGRLQTARERAFASEITSATALGPKFGAQGVSVLLESFGS